MSGIPIQVSRCGKTFEDGTRALEPIDLEIAAGETIVLLGPSGCGKTTTLRIIAGLESPDSGGQVLFDGVDVTPVPIEKRNVGMVFQSYALFPNMSVASNVEYGLKVRGMPAAQRTARVREMLAMMHIEPLAQRRIDQLSGGQRQRVALARAIATRPRVLLLDEPLTALDAKLRDSLRLEIDRLLRSLNITTVYVTHDQAEAMALGDRIAVMEHGRIAQIGSPQDIYCAPASAFVADFIGTMNRISGKAESNALRFAGGSVPLGPDSAAATEVMFRPEDVQLVSHAAASFSGKVVSSFFLGDHTRLGDRRRRRPVGHSARRAAHPICQRRFGALRDRAQFGDRSKVLAMILCQISDLHIKPERRLAYGVVDTATMLERCVVQINRLPQRPDAVIATGDLVDGGTPAEYSLLRELLSPLTMPVYLMPGNHDERQAMRQVFDDHAYLQSTSLFIQYVINGFPLRVIALDTVIPGQGGGTLCDERLTWLERALAESGKPTVVALHHPPFVTGIGHMDRIALDSSIKLEQTIARHPQVERVIAGHLHRPITVRFGGTVASTCPSPAHQVVLDIALNGADHFIMEPPAFQLHWWNGQRLVTHTEYIGDFGPSYPFRESGKLID